MNPIPVERHITGLVGVTGLEPATTRTPCEHSSHLNYTPTVAVANKTDYS